MVIILRSQDDATEILAKISQFLAERGMKAKCKPKPDDVKQGRFLKNGQSAKRGLNRSISDASWGTLIEKIQYAAAKLGKSFFKVDPKNTSRTCSKCGVIDTLSRFGEKFVCTSYGYEAHADKQAAGNIKTRTIQQNGLTIKKSIKIRKDFAESKQLVLFETPNPELTGVKRRQRASMTSTEYDHFDDLCSDLAGNHVIDFNGLIHSHLVPQVNPEDVPEDVNAVNFHIEVVDDFTEEVFLEFDTNLPSD